MVNGLVRIIVPFYNMCHSHKPFFYLRAIFLFNIHTSTDALECKSRFSTLTKVTVACRLGQPGIKPTTFQ